MIDSYRTRICSLMTAGILALSFSSLIPIAQGQTVPNEYSDEAINEILVNCRQATEQFLPPDIIEPLCQCVLDEFQSQFSYDEYEKLLQKADEDGEDPEVFANIGEQCAVNLI